VSEPGVASRAPGATRASPARNVLFLGACAVGSQVILFGTLPWLARLYAPDAFGVYTIFLGVTAIAGVFAGLRYDSAAVLPRLDGGALALANVVLLLGATVALVILAVTFLLQATGLEGYGGMPILLLGAAAAAAVLLGAVQRATIAWCTRAGRFGWLGANQLALNAAMVLLQIMLAAPLVGSGLGLIAGNVLGLLLSATVLALLVRRDSGGRLFSRWSVRHMAGQARRYRNFPTYMVLYALAGTVRERVLHFLLGYFAGAGFLGRFAMASRLVGAPNSLAYSAVSPVFYSYASRAPVAQAARLAAALVEVSAIVMLPPFLFAMAEAELLTTAVLGPQWAGTGEFIRLLALPMLVLAATSWLDRLFDVHQRQRVALALEGGFTIVSLAVVAALLVAGQPRNAVAVFAAGSVVYYLLYAWLAFVANGLPGRALLRPVMLMLMLGVAAAVVCVVAASWPSAGERAAAYGSFWLLAALLYMLRFGGRDALRSLLGREGRA